MKTSRQGLLLLLAFAVTLFGCDSTELIPGNERIPQREGPPYAPIVPLSYEFFQRTAADAPLVQVGRVEVDTFVNPINLRDLKRTDLDFDQPRFSIRVFSEEAEEKNIVLFSVIHNQQPDEFGHMRAPHFHLTEFSGTTAGKGAPIVIPELTGRDGVFYGFFLEGIGEVPTKPVRFTIETDKKTYDIEVDPATNLLPLRYAFQGTSTDFDLLPQADPYVEIKSRNQFANDKTAFQPLLLFKALAPRKQGPRLEWQEMQGAGPSSGWSSTGLMFSDDAPLYVIMLEGF